MELGNGQHHHHRNSSHYYHHQLNQNPCRTLRRLPSLGCGAATRSCGAGWGRTPSSTTSPARAWTAALQGWPSGSSSWTMIMICSPASIRLAASQSTHQLASSPNRWDLKTPSEMEVASEMLHLRWMLHCKWKYWIGYLWMLISVMKCCDHCCCYHEDYRHCTHQRGRAYVSKRSSLPSGLSHKLPRSSTGC